MFASRALSLVHSFLPLGTITFALLLGLAASDAQAHPCKHHDDPEHPHCGGGSGGGGGDGSSTEPSTCTVEYMGGVSGICMDTCFFEAGEDCPVDNPGGECILLPPNDNTPGWSLAGSCRTTGTLVLPGERPFLAGNGHKLSLDADTGGKWNTDPVSGLPRENIPRAYAGITNGGHSIFVGDLIIEATSSLIAKGCAGSLRSAMSMDPDRTPNPELPRMAAANLTVQVSGGAEFCNALEYVGSAPSPRDPYFSGGPRGNLIKAGAYANAAIRVADINNTDNLSGKDYDTASTTDNIIEYSANGCVGILYEDVERGTIESNEVTPPGGGAGCSGNGIGIAIIRSGVPSETWVFNEPRPVNLSKNEVDTSITSAIAVHIEDSAVNPNATNVFTGDPGDLPYSTSGSNSIDFPQKGKARNRCNGEPILSLTDPC